MKISLLSLSCPKHVKVQSQCVPRAFTRASVSPHHFICIFVEVFSFFPFLIVAQFLLPQRGVLSELSLKLILGSPFFSSSQSFQASFFAICFFFSRCKGLRNEFTYVHPFYSTMHEPKLKEQRRCIQPAVDVLLSLFLLKQNSGIAVLHVADEHLAWPNQPNENSFSSKNVRYSNICP